MKNLRVKNALFGQVLTTDMNGTSVDLVTETIFCPNLAAILYFQPLNDEKKLYKLISL